MEKSAFWTTNGTGDGTSGGYTATEFYDFVRRLITTDQEASQGVLRGVDNELAVSGSNSPLSVATGSAIAHGFFYNNSAALNLTVTSPITGTTGGRVNLKVDWTAQTVRAVVQMNTDGVAAIPSLVQTAGSEWNIPLATFTITIAGAITLTDARNFCVMANYLTAASLENVTGLSVVGRSAGTAGQSAAITAGSDGQVLRRSGSVLGFGQVATAGIADDAVTAAKIADNAVGADQIDAGAVGNSELASDAVDDTKVGSRVPQFYRRQGGDTSDWSVAGTTTYTPTTVRMQAGAVDVVFSAQTSKTFSITFPTAFSNKPLVICSIKSDDSPAASAMVYVTSSSTTGFNGTVYCNGSNSDTWTVQWLAIGPE
jgi:hypothetical protein